MRVLFPKIATNGRADDVATRAVGFRLTPGRPDVTGVQRPWEQRPGAYPVKVRLDSGPELIITNGDALFFEAAFNVLQVFGEPGDVWALQVFEHRSEGVIPAARSSVAVQVQPPTACPTVAPTLATEGWKVRPGTRSHTLYASGTLTTARLWVRSASGAWYDTGEDLDFTTNPVQARLVYATADRVYLRAAAGSMNIEIDSECEVG